jgi:signal transduction histidine kinase/DNA-binding response OmpR family regulator
VKPRRASLSTKILVGFIVVFATIVTTTGVFQYWAMRQEMYGAVEASASNMGVLIESLIQEDQGLLRGKDLARAVQRFAQRVPDVADVMIYDFNGRVIADSDPGYFPGRDAARPESLLRAGQGKTYYVEDGRSFYRLVRPLVGAYDASRKSNVIATLSIDMQVSPVDARILRNISRDIGLRIALLSVFGLLVFTVTRRVFVRPLLSLAAAADRFGQTGFSPPVDIRTGDELEALAKSFNRSVEDRVRSEDLRRERHEADDANRAKSEFLANMSHEIRTPMNGVLGMLELAIGTELSPDQRDYITTARSSAISLVDIINDILDFSKIEAGHAKLDSGPFSLGESLADTIRSLGHRADQKGLEFAVEIKSDVPDALVGDAGRLRQVIINLVGNAIKFTERGEVVLCIGLDYRDEDSVLLHCFVSDTGIGIEAAHQERVFGAFQQADASTTRQFGGTGLGLAISSRVVKLLGGRIGLTSEAGKGTVFDFTARFDLQPAATVTPETANDARLQNLRVLVVDDSATNRRIIDGYLRGWGMRPTLAASGRDALEILLTDESADRFALIVADSLMPLMDGFQLIETVRTLTPFGGPTVLMLSSVRSAVDIVRSRDLGVSSYLTKPVRRSALLTAITEALVATGAPARQRIVASDAPVPLGKSLRVLVAEDNAVNQKLAAAILQRAGHISVVVPNGEVAVAAMERDRFDVVLMDVQMPVMGGFEATGLIRAMEAGLGRRTPIIAVTARAMKGDREACLAAGMDAFVPKPIQSAKLLEVLEQLAAGSLPDSSKEVHPDEFVGTEKTLDEAALMKLVGGNRELASELAELYLTDLEPRVNEITAAVGARDGVRLRSAAHALRGSSGSIKAEDVSAAAGVLEGIGQSGELDGVLRALELLNVAVATLRPRLVLLAGEA